MIQFDQSVPIWEIPLQIFHLTAGGATTSVIFWSVVSHKKEGEKP